MTFTKSAITTGDSHTHSIDTDLSRVRSFEKKQELFNTLHSEHPDHYSRLYLVGFLKFVGYSLEEICSIIDTEVSWEDYDRTMTYCQVRSIFKPGEDGGTTQPFLNGFVEGVEGENTFTKVVSPFNEKLCIVGSVRVTCFFKMCDVCPLKVTT